MHSYHTAVAVTDHRVCRRGQAGFNVDPDGTSRITHTETVSIPMNHGGDAAGVVCELEKVRLIVEV